MSNGKMTDEELIELIKFSLDKQNCGNCANDDGEKFCVLTRLANNKCMGATITSFPSGATDKWKWNGDLTGGRRRPIT